MRDLHPENAKYPNFVTLLGITTDCKETHPSKSQSLIHNVPVGIAIDVRDMQSTNAATPNLTTLLGIIISYKESTRIK